MEPPVQESSVPSLGQEGEALADSEVHSDTSDVRVDGLMDEREPVGEDAQEVVSRVCVVGTHPCLITHGGSRMTCTKFTRYVTTYKGTWRNLGTLSKQPCKPKARRQAKWAGKAPHKQ
eukprot:4447316-Amphidinium_carterae.1